MQRAKDYLTGQLALSMESTTQHVMWLGEAMLARKNFISPSQTIASLREVTSEDIQALANELFTPENVSISLIAPDLADQDRVSIQSIIEELA